MKHASCWRFPMSIPTEIIHLPSLRFPFGVTSSLAVGTSTELHEASTDLFVIGGSGRADHNLLIGSRSCSRGSTLSFEARPSLMASAAPTVGAPLYPVRQPGLRPDLDTPSLYK